MEHQHSLGDHLQTHTWRRVIHSVESLLIAVVLLVTVVMSGYQSAGAAELTNRYVRLTSPVASDISAYIFSFNFTAANNVGSISYSFCSNSPLPLDPCTPPSGFNALPAVLAFQSGETGFSIQGTSTANRLVIGRPAAVVTPGNATYRFNTVTNASTNTTVFIRIAAHASTDGTGVAVDAGSVAVGFARQLGVAAFVPPYLTFCTAVTVALDCSSAGSLNANLGNLQTATPNVTTTQFAGATNDPGGYNVFVVGNTMTSGNQTISAMTIPTASVVGTAQFGVNIRDNSTPNIGQDPVGIGTATVQAGYNTPNQFKFTSGDLIARSLISTEFNLFTVTYLVNIPPGQAPGVYSTTVSYVATAAF